MDILIRIDQNSTLWARKLYLLIKRQNLASSPNVYWLEIIDEKGINFYPNIIGNVIIVTIYMSFLIR